tara:strand:- start:1064 stop:1246 length:183 start_codon:yes stop_codon:yes gene_type:complete
MKTSKFRVIIEIKSDDSPPRTVDRIEEATRPGDALIYAIDSLLIVYERDIKSIIITKIEG